MTAQGHYIKAASSPGAVASGKTRCERENRERGAWWLGGVRLQQSHNPTRTVLKQGATPGDEADIKAREKRRMFTEAKLDLAVVS